jgi:hypothetical protein
MKLDPLPISSLAPGVSEVTEIHCPALGVEACEQVPHHGLSLDDLAVRDRELDAVGATSGHCWVGQHLAELRSEPFSPWHLPRQRKARKRLSPGLRQLMSSRIGQPRDSV